MKKIFVCCATLLLSACLGMPKQVTPISGFELNRYLGKWYEVARLDHPFERGLTRVSAEYSMRVDGGVAVLNRGFDAAESEWKESEGKAFFVEDSETGYLKVSFFGPFYGSYVIFELDKENYQYAFISGPDHDYLWLLSRTPDLPVEIVDRFVVEAARRGLNTEELIFVEH
jgi:apolipoprotein D and lipocalin family protein